MGPIHIQIAKTRDGHDDYVQIMSRDQLGLNITIVSDEITVEDCREKRGIQTPEEKRL